MTMHAASNHPRGTAAAGPAPHAAARPGAAAQGLAGLLSLAAAPTFAVMALLTGFPGGGGMEMCSPAQDASPLGGMMPMYVLMSAFHLAPWIRLVAQRQRPPAAD